MAGRERIINIDAKEKKYDNRDKTITLLKSTINNPAVNPITAQKRYIKKEKDWEKKEKNNVTVVSRRVQNIKVNTTNLSNIPPKA